MTHAGRRARLCVSTPLAAERDRVELFYYPITGALPGCVRVLHTAETAPDYCT